MVKWFRQSDGADLSDFTDSMSDDFGVGLLLIESDYAFL